MNTLTQELKSYKNRIQAYLDSLDENQTFYTREFIKISTKIGADFNRYLKEKLDTLQGKDREKFIYKVVHSHVYRYNQKLGTDTLVFNTGSATHCPSIKLGKCQVGNKCYALSNEKFRPFSMAYRERQKYIPLHISSLEFATAILSKKFKDTPKFFRYSESGDFNSQYHVNWFSSVCEILGNNGYTVFGYTARTDYNLDSLVKNSTVNASNEFDNYNESTMNRFKAYFRREDIPQNTPICKCTLAKYSGGKIKNSCVGCPHCKKYTGTIAVVIS